MNKFKIYFILVSIFVLFNSCKNRIEKAIEGWWIIDVFIYDELDTKICLLSNSIVFNDNEVKLPITGNVCDSLSVWDEKGFWSVNKTDTVPFVLMINTENEMFNGYHELRFLKDERKKTFQIEVVSKKLYMIASKSLFNFESNINDIDYLINESNKKP